MKLKDLEREIKRMEESVNRMASINQNMTVLDTKVDHVRNGLMVDRFAMSHDT